MPWRCDLYAQLAFIFGIGTDFRAFFDRFEASVLCLRDDILALPSDSECFCQSAVVRCDGSYNRIVYGLRALAESLPHARGERAENRIFKKEKERIGY